MRDLVKDWRRWSKAERAAVVLIAAFVAVTTPVVLASHLHSTASESRNVIPGRFQ